MAFTVDAQVVSVAQELSQGIPRGSLRVVVGFRTPEQTTDHRFSVKLLEKDGNRHVALSNLKL